MLVDWLNEVLYLQDARDQVVAAIEVKRIDLEPATLDAAVEACPRTEELEGTAVKAVTFHRVVVEQRGPS